MKLLALLLALLVQINSFFFRAFGGNCYIINDSGYDLKLVVEKTKMQMVRKKGTTNVNIDASYNGSASVSGSAKFYSERDYELVTKNNIEQIHDC